MKQVCVRLKLRVLFSRTRVGGLPLAASGVQASICALDFGAENGELSPTACYLAAGSKLKPVYGTLNSVTRAAFLQRNVNARACHRVEQAISATLTRRSVVLANGVNSDHYAEEATDAASYSNQNQRLHA